MKLRSRVPLKHNPISHQALLANETCKSDKKVNCTQQIMEVGGRLALLSVSIGERDGKR